MTAISAVGPYLDAVNLTSELNFAWANSNAAAGNYFQSTGRELLLLKNNSGLPATVTFDSVNDPLIRQGDITGYIIDGAEISCYWFGNQVGWRNRNGNVFFQTSDNDVQYAVIRLEVMRRRR